MAYKPFYTGSGTLSYDATTSFAQAAGDSHRFIAGQARGNSHHGSTVDIYSMVQGTSMEYLWRISRVLGSDAQTFLNIRGFFLHLYNNDDFQLGIGPFCADKTNNSSQNGSETADYKIGLLFDGLFVVPAANSATISEFVTDNYRLD